MNTNHINEALLKYIQLPWITEDDRNAIVAQYGSDVLSSIDEMYLFAVNDKVWTTIDYSEAYNQTIVRLRIEYSFLSEQAVKKIANLASYSWK